MSKKTTGAKKTIAGCLALTAILSSSVLPVYANDNLKENTSAVSLEKENSDILVDSKLKEFNNLDKVHKYLDFDYKVPDYIKSNFSSALIRTEKYNDGNKTLELRFANQTKGSNYGYGSESYTLYEFKGEPIHCLKDIKYGDDNSVSNIQVSSESKSLNSIDGIYITITADIQYAGDDSKENQRNGKDYSKFFVFNKDGVYYSVEAIDFDGEEELKTEINKIASSLKKPEELQSANYVIDTSSDGFYGMDIYDKDDLNKAIEYLGYTPKFITEINDDIKIEDCHIFHSDSYGSKMTTFQCDYKYKGKGMVVFIQEKDNDNYGYEEVAKNGYDLQTDWDNDTQKKVPVEKLKWDSVDIYKYFDDCDNKYIYQWKIGDMYYFFETYFDGEKENVDDIARTLFDAK